MLQHEDAVGLRGFVEVGGREDGGDARILHAADDPEEFAPRERVHPDGGLVENQKPRLRGQRAGEPQLLLHAARKVSGEAILEAGQPGERHEFLKALLGGRLADAAELCEEFEVLLDREPLVEPELLRHEADQRREGGVLGVGPKARQPRPPGVGAKEPGQEAQKRRLSRAVRADERDELARFRNGEACAVHRPEGFPLRVGPDLGEAVDLEEGGPGAGAAQGANSTVTGCPRRRRFSGSASVSFTS